MEALLRGLSGSLLAPLYALVAGILTSASPCALAAVPLVIGHMTASRERERHRDLTLFILGMSSALTLAGLVAALLGRALIFTAPWLRLVAGAAFVVAGASYLGLLGGKNVCGTSLAGLAGQDAIGAGADGAGTSPRRLPRPLADLAMGALYGLSASPCSTPVLVSILTLVASSGSAARGALLLLCYSIGQSFLVAVAGLATARFGAFLEKDRNVKALGLLRAAGGVVLMGFGLYVIVRPYM